jgi:hypothetical protein
MPEALVVYCIVSVSLIMLYIMYITTQKYYCEMCELVKIHKARKRYKNEKGGHDNESLNSFNFARAECKLYTI